MDFDVLISGGEVLDGSGAPAPAWMVVTAGQPTGLLPGRIVGRS